MKEITNSIHKEIQLAAPRYRVWRALADSAEFGRWFGVQLEGPWKVGQSIRGQFIRKCTQEVADEALKEMGIPSAPLAETIPDVFFDVTILEPESRFAFRWIPYCIEAGIDPLTEPKTLVEFKLTGNDESSLLQVTESGFDNVPVARRARAFLMHTGGWIAQLENIANYIKAEQIA